MSIFTTHRGGIKNAIFTAETPKKLFRGLEIMAGNREKGWFEQERMFGRASKIPIAKTLYELVEMGFVDYGEYAAFLRIQDTLGDVP